MKYVELVMNDLLLSAWFVKVSKIQVT